MVQKARKQARKKAGRAPKTVIMRMALEPIGAIQKLIDPLQKLMLDIEGRMRQVEFAISQKMDRACKKLDALAVAQQPTPQVNHAVLSEEVKGYLHGALEETAGKLRLEMQRELDKLLTRRPAINRRKRRRTSR